MTTKEIEIYHILKKILERIGMENGDLKFSYFHYTSLETAYALLDGDSLWGCNARFSNDDTELQQFCSSNYLDDYVTCFCAEGDQLSQWRGYCHNGGVSIKMDINHVAQYSVLHTDFESSGKYELICNRPLPVVYVNSHARSLVDRNEIEKIIESDAKYAELVPENILPFLKNNLFHEEKESRLVFQNVDSQFSKCIRFRKLPNGSMIPYIVLKYGDVGKQKTKCRTNPNKYDSKKLQQVFENREKIVIEEGYNQEAVYNEIFNRLQEYRGKNGVTTKISIRCEGHLPVEKITISPMPDAKRQAEIMQRFCHSKYWLRNVEVVTSEIPLV